MKDKEFISKLDKEKLIQQRNKNRKLYWIFIPLFVISLIYCIGSIVSSILQFFIGLVFTLITGFLLSHQSKKNEEINYYINIIETKEQNELYEKAMINVYGKNNNKSTDKYKLKTKTITSNEQYFLDIIKKHFSNNYEIRPQVPLSSIIEKNKEHNWEYQNELNRIIDFGLFDKQTTTPLLLIEINDRTHHESKRIYRDQKVKDICEQAGIKLIAFWSEYSNTEQYIVERISKELNSD